jgi:hypothetical protein
MQVVKRTGEREDVSFDKVPGDSKNRSAGLKAVNVFVITEVCAYIHEGVKKSWTSLQRTSVHR